MSPELKLYIFIFSFVLGGSLTNVLFDYTHCETLLFVVGLGFVVLWTLIPEIIDYLDPEETEQK